MNQKLRVPQRREAWQRLGDSLLIDIWKCTLVSCNIENAAAKTDIVESCKMVHGTSAHRGSGTATQAGLVRVRVRSSQALLRHGLALAVWTRVTRGDELAVGSLGVLLLGRALREAAE
jgi:hypothetical protein